MDGDHQQWLLRVIEASARAAEQLEAAGDPYVRSLHADMVALHDRLQAELDALQGDG